MKPTTLCTLLAAAGAPISAFRIVTYRGSDCRGAVMNSFSVSSASLGGGCSEAINSEASSATIQPESGDGERDGMYLYLFLPTYPRFTFKDGGTEMSKLLTLPCFTL
jgi:hypothetical protein